MAHGLIRPVKHGLIRPTKHNVLTFATGGGSMVGVTQDAASGKYFPSTAGEWTQTMGVAGIGSGNPTNLYLCQDLSGDMVAAMGGINLTQSGTVPAYGSAVAGFTRVGIKLADGTAAQKFINSVSMPNPNTTSVLYMAVLGFPAAPAAARCLFANGGTLDCRFSITGKVTIINGASTTGAGTVASGAHIIMLKHDLTNSIFQLYTDLESLAGTFAAVASNPMLAVGGQTAAAGDITYLYVAEFSGAAAEMSTAQIRTLLQTLGWTIPW